LTPERPAGYSSSLPMTAARPRRAAAPGRSRPKPKRGASRAAGRSPLDRLRAICLALPEATEKVAWGEPTWRVKDRLFAQLDDHHHGAEHLAVWLPAPLGEQEAMVFTDPVHFFRPPYVGLRGWVGVRIDRELDWAVVAKLVGQAYRLVAPPRLRDALDSGAVPRTVRRRETTRRS